MLHTLIQLLNSYIFPYEFLVFAVLAVSVYRSNKIFWSFCRYIEKHQPVLWELVGSPNMSLPGFILYRNRLKLLAFTWFLWRRQYLDVNDPTVRTFCEKLRTYGIVIACCLLFLTIFPVVGVTFFGLR